MVIEMRNRGFFILGFAEYYLLYFCLNFEYFFPYMELVLLLIFMLPRLEEKDQYKEASTYRAFTREILKRKSSDNNFANLKMLKDFLDQEPVEITKK